MLVRIVRRAALAAALALSAPLAAAQTYSLADGFSTTSNQSSDLWSYRKSGTSLLDSYIPIQWNPVHGQFAYQAWAKTPHDTGGQSPTIGRLGGKIVGRPGWTNCLGGCTEFLEIRFRAPKAGTVNVTARLSDLESMPGCFGVASSAGYGGHWGGGTIPAGGSTGVVHAGPFTVSTSSALNFRITTGNGCDWHDLTAIELAISYDGVPDLDDFAATPDAVSLSAGGTVDFALNAGASFANTPYLVLGSVSGTSPGIPTAGGVLPLQPDAWFHFTALHPNGALLPQSAGSLDALGLGAAAFVVPPGSSAALVGIQFSYAYLLHDGAGSILHASDAVSVTLAP